MDILYLSTMFEPDRCTNYGDLLSYWKKKKPGNTNRQTHTQKQTSKPTHTHILKLILSPYRVLGRAKKKYNKKHSENADTSTSLTFDMLS